MNKDIIETIANYINEKKDIIFSVQNLCGKKENDILKILFERLGINNLIVKKLYDGLFGWKKYEPDGYLFCNSSQSEIIIEGKKVTEGAEYGYWHALIQGLLYSKRHYTKYEKYPYVLCIILDWGRKAAIPLDSSEKDFIDYFVNDNIYIIRVSMVETQFIEHNLKGHGNWTEL
ncbi:MAG: hypothetical protein U9R17_17470 [Thermodesulfobacteriota bacterium]|nr:hypothetical protein [Thermodesulfobacteriota bacterium]